MKTPSLLLHVCRVDNVLGDTCDFDNAVVLHSQHFGEFLGRRVALDGKRRDTRGELTVDLFYALYALERLLELEVRHRLDLLDDELDLACGPMAGCSPILRHRYQK